MASSHRAASAVLTHRAACAILPRRAASAILLLALCGTAAAQSFPNRPVRLVIGFPPGGGIDIVARLMAPGLGETLGQPVIVENRPGAGGTVGMDAVAKAPADGHTLFLGTTGNITINQFVYQKLPFDIDRDFMPLSQVASVSFLVYVNSALPVRSIAELSAYAKANPGKMNFGTSGSGGLPHLACELLSTAAGLKAAHVPYKGSAPALNDLLAGQVQYIIDAVAIGLPHVKAGKLRALGTTGPKRLPSLPDVPAVAESIPGFEAVNWYGFVVAAGTPQPVVRQLHGALAKVMAQPDIREKLVAQGIEPMATTPEEFGAFMKKEAAKWSRVVKEANVKAD
jgi:tripartite-type tricarboxylate transporter receptor subunit TctC